MASYTNQSSEDFTIRIRFRLPANKLGIGASELHVGTSPSGQQIHLKSYDKEKAISDSEWLVLFSEGWETEDTATAYSTCLLDSLCRSLCFHNLGADIGRRTPGGFFFNAFLKKIEEDAGRPVLNDERGIMIFPTNPKPLVANAGEVSPTITTHGDKWAVSFQKAIDNNELFNSNESMAFDLLTMAHRVQSSADACFVLSFAAFETLLEPTPRPESVCDHVDSLISLTRESGIPKSDKDSLLGTLKWMKSYSIRSAGRKLVKDRLKDSKFGNIDAEELFLKGYELRNRLMHGNQPYASWREVSGIAGPFEQLVSSLLAGKLYAGKQTST